MIKAAVLAPVWALTAIAVASPFTPPAYGYGWAVGQSVKTSSGTVEGHAAQNAVEVSEYLGIPFALPPTGSLRFQPPVKYNGSSIVNGTDFGFSCLEAGPINENWPHSEDCLTLNVWTKPQVGEKKKAVLVWIYGGGYIAGSSRDPEYNGKYIADQTDVVVVSINYRLNIFGFPGNPATSANLGLLDMRLAMEWIRDNVAQFGGDVSRITVFGQSAGAGMVDFYSYAWANDSIARGFILQSATLDGFPPITNTSATQSWRTVSKAAGCGNDPVAMTECMRTKPTEEIMDALAASANATFNPTEDGVVVFTNYTSRESAGGAYLIGNTENETGFFRLLEANHSDAYWTARNARFYTCSSASRITRTIREGNPSWRYRYFGDFPNVAISVDPPSGAYHTAELPILFDTVSAQKTSLNSSIPSTPQEVAIGKYLRGAWAAFAKDPEMGLVSYADGWPMYDPSSDTLVRLAYNNQTGANLARGDLYDDVCELFG